MAIDFPPNAVNPNPPSDGDTYVDAASGTEWVYDSTNKSWTISGTSSPGGGALTYIGEHDFRAATLPSPAAVAGNVYSQSDFSGTANVNGVYNGIAGDPVTEGDLVLYTGSSWTFLTNVPGYPNLGDGNGDTLDERYVRTAGGTNLQTITGTGGLEVQGGVRVKGGDKVEVNIGLIQDGGLTFVQNGIACASVVDGSFYVDGPGNSNAGTCSKLSTFGILEPKADGTASVIVVNNYTGLTGSVVNYNFNSASFNASGGGLVTNELVGYATAGNLQDIAPTNIGFKGALGAGAGKNNYNFYAIGTAPNYFKGNIDCDGLINGAFSLRMDTDDPAAFQTTYTTDDEGNQVEQQTYVGTTEDLLSIIKDLRARVAALEAA